MTERMSSDTKAVLLLTAPLGADRSQGSPDILKPAEFKRLAQQLLEANRRPSDLLTQTEKVLEECGRCIEAPRIDGLLARGFRLAQAVERWQTRSIWVASRYDDPYPERLMKRLGRDAPPLLYGCGQQSVLDRGGLAVVGSRRVDDDLIAFAEETGRLAASAGKTLISGGAKGIDQASRRGALSARGTAIGIVADSLERKALTRENRNLIRDGRLVLVSPYDPSAGFNVGHAMQRNKLIYALADCALVVNAEIDKGGTWAGATEQLEKLHFAPLYVRSTGTASRGLDALRARGALPWPNPEDEAAFNALLAAPTRSRREKRAQAPLPFAIG